MKPVPVEKPEPDPGLRNEAEVLGFVGADTDRAVLEAQLGNASDRRRLSAAAAGRSGHHDVSECVEEILVADAARWRARRDVT